MAKLTLADVSAGYGSTTTTNANNALVEAALENTLSRDGTAPNTMSANLDMNSNKITNLTDGTNAQDAVTKSQLDAVDGLSPSGNETVSGNWTFSGTTAFTGAVSMTTALPETSGGTGLNTYTTGDIVYSDGSNSLAKLGVGTSGQLLRTSAGGVPEWATVAGGGLNNVVEDLTPQLGGDLDLNSSDITGTGDISITGTVAATSYGGITEANLVDKSATETISAVWTFSSEATFSAGVALGDTTVTRPKILDYGLTSPTNVVVANAVSLSFVTGNVQVVDLEDATGTVTITLSNPPASGVFGEMCVRVQQDTTAPRAITWAGGSFLWPGGSAPTMSTAADAIDIYTFKTWDGGTTYYCNYAQAYA
jgi:hypothetical protein